MDKQSKGAERKNLNKKLAAYGAAAGAVLAVAQPAQADVVYTPYTGGPITYTLDVDLNGDNQVDAMFSWDSTGYLYCAPLYSASLVTGGGMHLASSVLVAASARWDDGKGLLASSVNWVRPGFEDGGYLGIRIHTATDTTNWYYGWVKVEEVTTSSVTVSGWAYESDPGVAILTGDMGTSGGGGDPVPEPTSLALLAMGAAGLAAYRRKQTAA